MEIKLRNINDMSLLLAEHPSATAAVVGLVLLVVGPPLVKLVREFWAPRLGRLRRRLGRWLLGDRPGVEETPEEEVAGEVRRLPERV
ncbi:hypothetical protein [Streptomyces goshikiensis]|uniref:hypothetical protein n=1 Tax=Streptomyces goshikiensis TaxID=1942 RepID=UPI0036F5F4FE